MMARFRKGKKQYMFAYKKFYEHYPHWHWGRHGTAKRLKLARRYFLFLLKKS